MGGRPPKPYSVIEGKIGKQKMKERVEAEESLKGSCDEIDKIPSWLDKEARKIYKWMIKQLKDIGIVTNLDVEIVAICSDAQSKMHQASKMIQEQGLIVEQVAKGGYVVQVENPYIKIYEKYQKIFQKNIAELGLSPVARARMSLIKIEQNKQDQDPLLKILSEEDDCDEI